jgi:hypothetical protein
MNKRKKNKNKKQGIFPAKLALAEGAVFEDNGQIMTTETFEDVSESPYQPYMNPFAAYENTFTTERRLKLLEAGLAGLQILLAIRFAFQLFGATFKNIAAAIVYIITFPFVMPFTGVFGADPTSGLSKNELETLAAMFVWAVAVWTAIGLIHYSQKRQQSLQQ